MAENWEACFAARSAMTFVIFFFLVLVIILLAVVARSRSFSSTFGVETSSGTREDVIYADNNASTPVFPVALKEATDAYRKCFANPSSIHGSGRVCRKMLEQKRALMASLLGAETNEIVFTSGATESNNIAIRGVIKAVWDRSVRKAKTGLDRGGKKKSASRFSPEPSVSKSEEEDTKESSKPCKKHDDVKKTVIAKRMMSMGEEVGDTKEAEPSAPSASFRSIAASSAGIEPFVVSGPVGHTDLKDTSMPFDDYVPEHGGGGIFDEDDPHRRKEEKEGVVSDEDNEDNEEEEEDEEEEYKDEVLDGIERSFDAGEEEYKILAYPRIVLTPIEHASVYQTVESLKDRAHVSYVNVDGYGRIDMKHFADLVRREDTRLACVIMGNNEIGTVQDVRALSKLCRANGVHLHVDMTQIVGRYPVDMRDLGADTATMSAHKFHGPKGVGALYVRRGARVTNFSTTGGGQELDYRGGTENVGGICGMVTALERCEYLRNLGGVKEVQAMRDDLKRAIKAALPEAKLNGHPEYCLYNTLSLCLPINSRAVVKALDAARVYVNVGCACSKGESSKTLLAIGRSREEINGSLRISLGFFNTPKECRKIVDELVRAVRKAQNDLKKVRQDSLYKKSLSRI